MYIKTVKSVSAYVKGLYVNIGQDPDHNQNPSTSSSESSTSRHSSIKTFLLSRLLYQPPVRVQPQHSIVKFNSCSQKWDPPGPSPPGRPRTPRHARRRHAFFSFLAVAICAMDKKGGPRTYPPALHLVRAGRHAEQRLQDEVQPPVLPHRAPHLRLAERPGRR